MKKPPQVEVEWIDAVERDFSGTVAEAVARGTLMRRFQAGYLVHRGENAKGERVVILAQTVDPPENSGEELRVEGLTVIPQDWVRSVKYTSRRGKKGVVGGGSRSLESPEKPSEQPEQRDT